MNAFLRFGFAALLTVAALSALWVWVDAARGAPPEAGVFALRDTAVPASHTATTVLRGLHRTALRSAGTEIPEDWPTSSRVKIANQPRFLYRPGSPIILVGWNDDPYREQFRELMEKARESLKRMEKASMIEPAAAARDIFTLEKLTEHADPQIAERAKAALRQVRGR